MRTAASLEHKGIYAKLIIGNFTMQNLIKFKYKQLVTTQSSGPVIKYP